jgi:hypothetical protein
MMEVVFKFNIYVMVYKPMLGLAELRGNKSSLNNMGWQKLPSSHTVASYIQIRGFFQRKQ